jgi:hypothetical protein
LSVPHPAYPHRGQWLRRWLLIGRLGARRVLHAAVLASVAPLSGTFAQAPVRFTVSDDVASCLKVRVRPESSAPDFVCLTPGTQVEAVGVAPYWRQIQLQDGRLGWAAKKFLQLSDTPPLARTTDDREDAWLEVHVVDVGQGDGIWIHTFDDNIPGNGRYEGYNIIVDGGPNGSDQTNELLRYVRKEAHPGAVIDALIITHPHIDHFPGARGIPEALRGPGVLRLRLS